MNVLLCSSISLPADFAISSSFFFLVHFKVNYSHPYSFFKTLSEQPLIGDQRALPRPFPSSCGVCAQRHAPALTSHFWGCDGASARVKQTLVKPENLTPERAFLPCPVSAES